MKKLLEFKNVSISFDGGVLYKNINEIIQTDIDGFVNEINLCVSDKFNKLCEFVIN